MNKCISLLSLIGLSAFLSINAAETPATITVKNNTQKNIEVGIACQPRGWFTTGSLFKMVSGRKMIPSERFVGKTERIEAKKSASLKRPAVDSKCKHVIVWRPIDPVHPWEKPIPLGTKNRDFNTLTFEGNLDISSVTTE